jgi:hypothetical protein
MRIVQWAAQERVDQPDITAMSFLALGEFRRLTRALLVGEDVVRIVRGFAVEAAAVPDATVLIKLDPGFGQALSVALGAEDVGTLDYGQLIGDRDSNFATEGNAQQILDFTGQPVGPYTVEMQFVYATGANDNRAFWNPAGNVEFVAATDTRFLPTWVARRVPGVPSGGEWIPLATVVWGGAIVNPVDITDIRTFVFEGAAPWRTATQGGAGGMPDFSRSQARGALSVERNEVYRVLRALGRQVQDIKGASDANFFDWYSRPFAPWDPSLSRPLNTKNLRSIDTVTYTLGDGVTSWGDFNGVTALDDCLVHLTGMAAANLPERVEIVVKHGAAAYTWTTPIVLAPAAGRRLQIVMRAGSTGLDTPAFPPQEKPFIDGTGIAAGATNLLLTGQLEIHGLAIFGKTGAGNTIFNTTDTFVADDCNLVVGGPDVAQGYLVKCAAVGALLGPSRITNCLLQGRVQMSNLGAGGGLVPVAFTRPTIDNCWWTDAQLRLIPDAASANPDSATTFLLRNCVIAGRTASLYTGSFAVIDARCADGLTVTGCRFSWLGDENCIDGRAYVGASPKNWLIEDCAFDSATPGTHAVGAGGSGAQGTGWAISLGQTGRTKGMRLRGLRIAMTGVIDSGGVRLYGAEDFRLDDITFDGNSHGGGGADSWAGVLCVGNGLFQICESGSIRGVHYLNGASARMRVINLDFAKDVEVSGGNFAGTAALSALFGAIRTGSGCQDLRILGCHFDLFGTNTVNNRTILVDGSVNGLRVDGCMFRDCGGFVIVRTLGSPTDVSFNNNTVSVDPALAQGEGASLASMSNVQAVGNTFIGQGPALPRAVIVDSNEFLVMANRAHQWDFQNVGGAFTGIGFADITLNLFANYIP